MELVCVFWVYSLCMKNIIAKVRKFQPYRNENRDILFFPFFEKRSDFSKLPKKSLETLILVSLISSFLLGRGIDRYCVSLFERLQRGGYPVQMLKTQYRMHPEVCYHSLIWHYKLSHFYATVETSISYVQCAEMSLDALDTFRSLFLLLTAK